MGALSKLSTLIPPRFRKPRDFLEASRLWPKILAVQSDSELYHAVEFKLKEQEKIKEAKRRLRILDEKAEKRARENQENIDPMLEAYHQNRGEFSKCKSRCAYLKDPFFAAAPKKKDKNKGTEGLSEMEKLKMFYSGDPTALMTPDELEKRNGNKKSDQWKETEDYYWEPVASNEEFKAPNNFAELQEMVAREEAKVPEMVKVYKTKSADRECYKEEDFYHDLPKDYQRYTIPERVAHSGRMVRRVAEFVHNPRGHIPVGLAEKFDLDLSLLVRQTKWDNSSFYTEVRKPPVARACYAWRALEDANEEIEAKKAALKREFPTCGVTKQWTLDAK